MDETKTIKELLKEVNALKNELKSKDEELHQAYNRIGELVNERNMLKSQITDLEIYKAENTKAVTHMIADYDKLLKENQELHEANDNLSQALEHVTGKEQLKAKELFGTKSEKISNLLKETNQTEVIDEDAAETPSESSDTNCFTDLKKSPKRIHVKKKTGKRKEDISRLPEIPRFLIDTDKLNDQYGEYNWTIVNWHVSRRIEYPKMTAYVLTTYTPVISVGLEHQMISLPSKNEFYPGSFASPSLVAEIMYQKYALFVPLYRIENSFRNMGLNISRQTMSNWIVNLTARYFWMIYNYLIECLMQIPYHQCDETTLLVIKDGRAAGTKSYVWLHTSSELCEANPIIIYCYEKTRGTDHLREFYKNFKGHITSDAYCSYQILQKENEEKIIVCGCMMHCRRRWVESLALINKSNLSEEQINNLTETKALRIIGEVYDVENALKHLTPEERRIRRGVEVRPIIERYFEFVESLDITDATMSEKCIDAVNYSINQKAFLMRFLEDGNIPIDNGFSERAVKSVALLRKASLFCYSIEGAETNMIMHSIFETAKANGANPYQYVRYILETMHSKMDCKDRSFLSDMVPWSEEYKTYEKEHEFKVESPFDHGGYSEKPKTPRKKDRQIIA